MEAPPPLFSRKRGVPPQVFGFVVTEEDLLAWAVAHNLNPEDKELYRCEAAWEEIFRRMPAPRRSAVIRNENDVGSISSCVVIGSNLNSKDMLPTQDIELIKKLYEDVDLGIRPGWYVMTRA